MISNWFAVDKEGLAKLIEKRGKSFAIFELAQNCWDTDTSSVRITLDKFPCKPLAHLVVEDDDPDGFHDLAHAYTLFAESEKKDDPEKRGRFNLGEKLVLAVCQHAKIRSTKGSVIFKADGTREQTCSDKTKSGSRFEAVIRLTHPEYDEVCKDVHRLIPPILTLFNGVELVKRDTVASFDATLQTVKADDEGNLTRTKRKTRVDVYETDGDEAGWVYELGIPVVETGDRYHVDVQQKVPVNLDRDNVPPSYLRDLRVNVLNEVFNNLTEEEATETWVSDALGHKDIEADAVEEVLTQRFGKKRAIYDPSDAEANNRLVGQGYKLIHGGSLSSAAWGNVRSSKAALPAGTIAPTPKPYSEDPNAPNVDVVPREKWTDGMKQIEVLCQRLSESLLDITVDVTIVNTSNGFGACYGHGSIDFNLRRLGHRWFNNWRENLASTLDLIVHEFGHHFSSNHLSEDYYDGLTELAGKLAVLALEKPETFDIEVID